MIGRRTRGDMVIRSIAMALMAQHSTWTLGGAKGVAVETVEELRRLLPDDMVRWFDREFGTKRRRRSRRRR